MSGVGPLGADGSREGPGRRGPEDGPRTRTKVQKDDGAHHDDSSPSRWETDETGATEARGLAAALGVDPATAAGLAAWRRSLIRADADEAAQHERALLGRGFGDDPPCAEPAPGRAVALALAGFGAAMRGEAVRGERLARQALRLGAAGPARAEALLALGTSRLARGQLVRARLALDEALAVLGGWLAERARMRREAAGDSWRPDAAAGVAVRAACLAALLRSYLHLWAGEKMEALSLAERWHAAAPDGLPGAEARGMASLATAAVLLDVGDAAGSLQAAEVAADLLERAGHVVLLARALDQQALAHLVLGRGEAAVRLLGRSRALQEATTTAWLAYTLLNGARVELEAGRLDEVPGWLDPALGRVGRGRDEHLLPSALVMRAELLRRRGDGEGAAQALAAALDVVARHGLDNCVRSYLAPALGSLTGLAPRLPGLVGGVQRALVELAAAAGPSPAVAAEPVPASPRRNGAGAAESGGAVPSLRVPLRLRLLGRFEVEVGGVPVPGDVLRASGPRRLLAYLVLNRDRCLTRDDICDAFWPDSDPQSAQRMFYGALKQCRRALAGAGLAGEDVVACSAGCYTVAPVLDAWVDAVAFEELGREGLSRPPAEALPLLREALALWAGVFLPGVSRCRWTDAVRARLAALRRDLLLARARALLSLGDKEEARRACLACLAEEPHWEEAMRLLADCR